MPVQSFVRTFVPKALHTTVMPMTPSNSQAGMLAAWGATGLGVAFYMIQPFDYIAGLMAPPPPPAKKE
eukprot:CAMPEP_0182855808 /NCGR_PEP_ID=MMETSP0034_2-20130328/2070_1 /TAXON_ID=156128 /ORGANISM="Nephroselmis pyriformis, Strain CCMP717" /LENGTH=67 /DNA_ID=CAMNT_0024986827 /DNA_START=58 /DNA_END=261 /DNA_ORIENTATION=+